MLGEDGVVGFERMLCFEEVLLRGLALRRHVCKMHAKALGIGDGNVVKPEKPCPVGSGQVMFHDHAVRAISRHSKTLCQNPVVNAFFMCEKEQIQ